MEKKFYDIVDRSGLKRDAHSKGLILTDTSVLKQEKLRSAKKAQAAHNENRLNIIEKRLERLEKLLTELGIDDRNIKY